MKKLLCLLLFTSQLLIAQRNVALLHLERGIANEPLPDAADFSEIPFEVAGGMIVVRASVNGNMGNFILDTGAPGIVLDAQNGAFEAVRKGGAISGGLDLGEVEVKNFQLGIIKKAKTQGNVLDVHHLEIACGMDIMGLVGYDVFRNYELVFDFPNKKIQAFRSGQAHPGQQLAPTITIPFTLCGHVPVVVAKIGGKRAFLGLDSGAEVNLLDKKYFDKIGAGCSNVKPELLTGLDNVPQDVISADVRETMLRREALPKMRYVFTDFSRLRKNFDMPIDGLLGVPFFKDKIVSIDYARKKIYIWE
ncbi:MAG: hypothetical protein IPM82_22850 [Saprospiraceae bacterium]|nr:hypothetical protein [Saprospiraceae bacterium]